MYIFRDYIHIMDLADSHVAALKKIFEPDFVGVKIYNLGTGTGASVLEMIKAFEEASGRKVPYEIVGRRAGDVSSAYCSPKLAEKELGWKASRGLVDMCKHGLLYTWTEDLSRFLQILCQLI